MRPWQDWIEKGVIQEVRRIQREHNGGQPWELAPPGALQTGRWSLEEERQLNRFRGKIRKNLGAGAVWCRLPLPHHTFCHLEETN